MSERSVTITVHMVRANIDVAAAEIPVEELAASLRRAGITHLQCTLSEGQRLNSEDAEETLTFEAILPES